MGVFDFIEKKIVNPIINAVTGIVGEVVSWFVDIPESPDFAGQQEGFLVNKQSNVAPIPVVYGERKIGGTRVFVATSGSNNQYLYLVIVLCEGEIQSIGDVYINDVLSTDSKYSGLVTINKYTGSDSQTADSMLVNANVGWTSSHRLRGLAYLAVRLAYNRDVFSSIPTINCIVQGRRVLDTRSNTTAYSTNPAMCLRDYLVNPRYGKGLSTSLIDVASFNQAATDCDTLVAKYVDASDSKIFECNAIIDTSRKLFDNVSVFLRGMRGILPFQNGLYRLIFEKDTASVYTFNEDNIIGGIQVSSNPKNTRYNKVTAKFVNPDANWQADTVTWPPSGSAEESTFLSEDSNYELSAEIDLPTITSVYAARDIARIVCLASRKQKLSVSLEATSDAIEVTVGDIVQVTHGTPEWVNKEFRVISMQIMSAGTIQLALQEHVDTVYPWEVGAEVDSVAESNLPDPFTVAAPTDLSVSASSFLQADGTSIPTLDVSWTASADAFVTQYEVQYRKGSETYQSIITEQTVVTIQNVVPAQVYDVQVRAINSLGVRSTFTSVNDTTAIKDQNAPSVPSGLNATGAFNSIYVAWAANTETDLKGYYVYENTTNNSATATAIFVNANAFTRSGLSAEATRYYWVSAIDFSENESAKSSVQSAVTSSAPQDGETGPRTTFGYVYYSLSSATAPTTPTATSFDFSNSTLSGLTANWSLQPPTVTTANATYWVSQFSVAEATYGGNQTITFQTPQKYTEFSGLVTFTGLNTELAKDSGVSQITTIHGGLITTGSVSADYIQIDDVTLDTDGSGTLIIKTGGVATGQIASGAVTGVQVARTNANSASLTPSGDSRSIATFNYTPSSVQVQKILVIAQTAAIWADAGDEDDPFEPLRPLIVVEGGVNPDGNRGFRSDGGFGPAYSLGAGVHVTAKAAGSSFYIASPYGGVPTQTFGYGFSCTCFVDLTDSTNYPSSGKVSGGRRFQIVLPEGEERMTTVSGKPMGIIIVVEFKR
jgi:hypothetical protein